MFDKNSTNNSDRDYINTKLIDTLKAGHKYVAKMYVSRGEAVDYAVATIGMLFTDTITTLPTGQSFISASPQIKSTILLADTLNWMLVQDTFIAVGNEAYLTIGNFNTTATSDTIKLTNYWPAFPIAYYYIDGVSVYDVATLGIEQFANKQQNVKLYPNPNNGNMMVEYNISNDATMEIVDVTGNIVGAYNLPATGTTLQIQNNNLQSGIYLYRVISNNAVIKQGKIVVMK